VPPAYCYPRVRAVSAVAAQWVPASLMADTVGTGGRSGRRCPIARQDLNHCVGVNLFNFQNQPTPPPTV
jgi:hypothetical protein